MRPNQLRAILIFLITPTTTWLIAGYPNTTENTESKKNLEQKIFFQLDTLYPRGINEKLSFH